MGDSLPLQHGCGRRQKQILGHNRDVVARFVQSLSDNCEVLCPPGTSDLPRVFFCALNARTGLNVIRKKAGHWLRFQSVETIASARKGETSNPLVEPYPANT